MNAVTADVNAYPDSSPSANLHTNTFPDSSPSANLNKEK